eukprot:c24131_g3_i2 orf=532-2109(-)
MASPTTDTAMGAPSEAEIAARLERATRSALASSSLISYSYSHSSSGRGQLSQPPSLADLLPHLGSPDAPRCPSCRAPLLFGPRSRLCLACAAPLLQPPPLSFTSSLAYRRFSEAFHIEGLETDFGEAGEEHFSDPDVDFASKSSSSGISLPLELGKQKVLSHVDVPSYQGTPYVESNIVNPDAQTPLALTRTSGDLGSVTPATMGVANVEKEKHASTEDYSTKLEGISLEDFFSNQVKPHTPALPSNSDLTLENRSMDPSGINVRKDSLFWDPLSNSIIPDGFDLMASTGETNTKKADILDTGVGVEDDDDDPFSSWEGDFQSAAPATAVLPTASSSFSFDPQVSAQPVMSGNFEDFFVNFSDMSVAESVKSQENNGLVTNGDLLGLDANIQNTLNTDAHSSNVDSLFFGSGWRQSAPPFMAPTTNSELMSLSNKQNSLLESSEEDLFGPLSSQQTATPMGNNSFDFVEEYTSTGTNDELLTERQASPSVGKTNKIVESLLAQLPDLSFLLADKLVMKTEGKVYR